MLKLFQLIFSFVNLKSFFLFSFLSNFQIHANVILLGFEQFIRRLKRSFKLKILDNLISQTTLTLKIWKIYQKVTLFKQKST